MIEDPDSLLNAHIEQKYFFYQANKPDLILTLDKFEEILFEKGAYSSDSIHTVAAPDLPVDRINERSDSIAKSIRDGHSVVVRKADRCISAVALIASELSNIFDSEVRANLYFTPPNAQGFSKHVDNHDVLVYQVLGSKEWKLFDQYITAPLNDVMLSPLQKIIYSSVQESVDINSLDSSLIFDGSLATNDLLYIPRGMPHYAVCLDQPSLHCTFAILSPAKCELSSLHSFASALLQPESTQNGSLKDIDILKLSDLSTATRVYTDDLLAYAHELNKQQSRSALPGNYLRTLCNINNLNLSTKLRRRRGLKPWLGCISNTKHFIFFDQRYQVPAELESVFEYLTYNLEFTPNDLPISCHDIDVLDFCRTLILDGLLEFTL